MADPSDPLNSTPPLKNAPVDPADGMWVTSMTDECLDDIVPPPGGGSRKPPADGDPSKMRFIPRPEYLNHEGRDLRIDLIRGYFVFAMIVDHVRGASPLYLITGGNRFYTSAAEGFILTSGLVAGMVYRRLIKRDGIAPALVKVLRRALTLFLLTIGLTFLFTIFSEFAGLPWAQGINLNQPVDWVLNVFTLHRTYYLVDVMLLYTVLFVISPLALLLLDQGKWYFVLLPSVVLYTLYQFYPDAVSLPWNITGNYLFNFSAWQLLFFGGLVMGFNQERIPTMGCRTTRVGLALTGVLAVLLIVAFYLIDTPTSLTPSEIAAVSPIPQDVRVWMQDYLFAKVDLRPGRLLASAVVFGFLFFAITHFWKPVKKVTGWLLLPLGQYALYGYTAHVAVVGVVAFAIAPLKLEYPGPQWLNALIQVASVLLIWFLAKRQWITPSPRTQRWWNLSPVVMGVVLVIILSLLPATAFPPVPQENVPAAKQARVPSRYGTPVPKSNSPTTTLTPTPISTPAPADSATLPGTDIITSPWLDPIEGTIRERWFYSPELDRDMPYYIYLPPDYGSATRRYPVLYMLHGLGGHREEWIVYGLINVVDREIRTGSILPMIVVLPQGDKGYWVNHSGDGPLWGEYLTRDLVGMIDTTYRTLRSPNSRGIGGLSMGGFGALHHAFLHPELFGVVGAHSASLRAYDGTLPYLGFGEDYAKKDPVELAKTAANLQSLRIWVDVGRGDEWYDRSVVLSGLLRERGVDHIFQVFQGKHDYEYWTEHALDYIRFYGHALAPQ